MLFYLTQVHMNNRKIKNDVKMIKMEIENVIDIWYNILIKNSGGH